jgi:biopolymer transport protein ExbD
VNFRRGREREEPEINLVPLIDVLLVILIFLMVTTTYSKFSELQITLPTADAEKMLERPNEINVAIAADGKVIIEKQLVANGEPAMVAEALKAAAAAAKDPIVIINADAAATHQSVINVMEAARLAQLPRLTFATQTAAGGSR